MCRGTTPGYIQRTQSEKSENQPHFTKICESIVSNVTFPLCVLQGTQNPWSCRYFEKFKKWGKPNGRTSGVDAIEYLLFLQWRTTCCLDQWWLWTDKDCPLVLFHRETMHSVGQQKQSSLFNRFHLVYLWEQKLGYMCSRLRCLHNGSCQCCRKSSLPIHWSPLREKIKKKII